jgi:hypothetical protein
LWKDYDELMYENVKIRPAETIPGMGWGIKKMMEGVNLTVIYCKALL